MPAPGDQSHIRNEPRLTSSAIQQVHACSRDQLPACYRALPPKKGRPARVEPETKRMRPLPMFPSPTLPLTARKVVIFTRI
jgi:hypothetical protein